ncbi:GroES-like protein [Cadophora sp. DSE1049]|nr:GroES-like protein [Cadophora sp. DSE1049]
MPHRAQVTAAYQPVVVVDYTPSTAQDGQILVEMKATSLNLLDWKRVAKNILIPSFPHVLGMDIVGVVSDKAGSSRYKLGDRVMGISTVGNSETGSFQTHAIVHERNTCLIPDELSFVEAATIPFALSTAACALYLGLGIPRPWKTNKDNSPAVLIWGAGGSVGSFAVQLAKASGSEVIAVCSEHSFDRMKEYGADVILAPSHPDIISLIRTLYPKLHLAFDLIVSKSSISSCVGCLENEAGVIATAIMYKDAHGRKSVSFKPTFSGAVQGARMGPGCDETGLELGKEMWQHLPALYELIGGLEMVNGGLERLQSGNYRAKLVVKI